MTFTFKPLEYTDFPLLVSWLGKPHVSKWWREPAANLEAVKKEFERCISGSEPTKVFIAFTENRPIGLVQSYWINDYPEHARTISLDKAVGIDLFIGEENYIGRGYGSILITEFTSKIIRNSYSHSKIVVADPEVNNVASIRAFEKAKFFKGRIVDGEHGAEQLMIFDL